AAAYNSPLQVFPQSACAPVVLTISAQRTDSSCRNLVNSVAVLGSHSNPSFVNCSLTSGSWRMRFISVFSLFTISGGVLAGAAKPIQVRSTYPGKPDSEAVGTLGSIATRLRLVTAIALSLPEDIQPSSPGVANARIPTGTCPATTAVTAGPAPP